jgi:glycosyltransferase involved in cell wall biosynthesis
MMKVLLCSPYDDGKSIHSGGIALWAKNLKSYYESLGDSAGVELSILPCNRSYYTNLNDSVFSRLIGGTRDYMGIVRSLNALLKKQHYDVVHICTSASFGLLRDLLFLKVIRRMHSHSVIHLRFGRIPELSKTRNWEWKLLNRVIAKSDKAVVIDKESYRTVIEAGFQNVQYLPNPLQEKTLQLINENTMVTRIPRSILFVGHVIPSKGVCELVQAAKFFPNIQLTIAGLVEEDMKKQLFQLAGENSANWLTLSGHMGYEETIKQMLSCDIFVLPSYTEGFPNVILEAMACGCAIIATDVGAIPEMLEDENGRHFGLLVKPKDKDGLKSAMEKMLNDETLCNECRVNARQRVIKRYSMSQIWMKMVAIWSELKQ